MYDLVGQSVATVNALGNRSTSVFDAAGEVVATVDPLTNRSTVAYDNAGRTRGPGQPAHEPDNHRL